MTRYIIALSELNIKNSDIIILLQNHYDDIKNMFENIGIFDKCLDLVAYYETFSDKDALEEALTKADEIISKNEILNIKTTYYAANTYPRALMLIDNPPAIIYYKGAEFSEISNISVACVGTRRPTKVSYNAVNFLVPQLVKEDCSIISGLACGVDKISHQACISSNGKTIAVLAHGLDIIYPKKNPLLAERILKSGGILMSEYPVGIGVDKYRLINRNRLIVGMSKTVIIFECDVNSGTMHNVEYAIKQRKKIFCPIIENITSKMQTGTKKLLDEKIAIGIKDGRDIEGILASVGSSKVGNKMSNMDIKYNYLYTILSIINSTQVLKVSLKELKIDVPIKDDMYNIFVELCKCNILNVDNLIKVLVKNNIADIEKKHIFSEI